MNRPSTTSIEAHLCNGCGLCVKVCPSDTIEMKDGKAVATGEHSLGCDHCAAICPTGAIKVGFVEQQATEFETFACQDKWIPYGQPAAADLVQLMRSRRSCRNFEDTPVPREVLEDLVKIGQTAPSGTNSQLWQFYVLPDRESVMALGARVGDFFKRLNKMAANPAARLFARLFMGDKLGEYYRGYYERVKAAIEEADRGGRERLFHGAPSVIIVSGRRGASCPSEDALLASQNILLAAHAMGYTSCLIGFVVEAMKNDKQIQIEAGIPANERVYSVIALGKTKIRYKGLTGRSYVKPIYLAG